MRLVATLSTSKYLKILYRPQGNRNQTSQTIAKPKESMCTSITQQLWSPSRYLHPGNATIPKKTSEGICGLIHFWAGLKAHGQRDLSWHVNASS